MPGIVPCTLRPAVAGCSACLGGRYHIGNFGGLRDGRTKQNTPITPHKITGRRNCQSMSITTDVAVHQPLPEDPLPITCECERNIKATVIAMAEPESSNSPSSRRGEMLIQSDFCLIWFSYTMVSRLFCVLQSRAERLEPLPPTRRTALARCAASNL